MSDVNEHLIAHLKARAIEGMAEYGVPLLPFNGRNPLRDKREELLDALVYNEQDIMEREAIVDLLERALAGIDPLHFWVLREECRDMAAKLRADCERSVPVEVGPYAHLACSPDCPANHVDPGEDVTGQFVIREWTAEEIAELQGEWKNEGKP